MLKAHISEDKDQVLKWKEYKLQTRAHKQCKIIKYAKLFLP
jgi:hypothetical protein